MATATDTFVNLSSWTVSITRKGQCWEWKAKRADGTMLEGAGPNTYIDKVNAERDAVRAMERYERSEQQSEKLSGFKLAERVHARET